MERAPSVQEAYEEALKGVIGTFTTLNGPRFKGYIKIAVRPRGARAVLYEELYCQDKDFNSHQKIFEHFCLLLAKARKIFGEKDFEFQIQNPRGELLKEIRLAVAKKVQAAAAVAQPRTATTGQEPAPEITSTPGPAIIPPPGEPVAPAASEATPAVTPTPDSASKPARLPKKKRVKIVTLPPPATSPAPPASPDQPEQKAAAAPQQVNLEPDRAFVPDSGPGLKPCPNRDAAIDFDSMKYYPTETTPANVRKVFNACEIRTNGELLDLIGSVNPTRLEWEIFIKGLQSKAAKSGVKLWPSSDGTLYWWLVKKMKWMSPFPNK